MSESEMEYAEGHGIDSHGRMSEQTITRYSVTEATNKIYNAFMHGGGLRHDQVKEIIEAIASRPSGRNKKIARYDVCTPTGSMARYDNGDYVLLTDHEAALAAKEARIAELEQKILADNAEWKERLDAAIDRTRALLEKGK